jgi:hypothetical protein
MCISAYFSRKWLCLGIDQFKRGGYPEEMVQLLGKVTDRRSVSSLGTISQTVWQHFEKKWAYSRLSLQTTNSNAQRKKKREIVKSLQELVVSWGCDLIRTYPLSSVSPCTTWKKERKARGIECKCA